MTGVRFLYGGDLADVSPWHEPCRYGRAANGLALGQVGGHDLETRIELAFAEEDRDEAFVDEAESHSLEAGPEKVLNASSFICASSPLCKGQKTHGGDSGVDFSSVHLIMSGISLSHAASTFSGLR